MIDILMKKLMKFLILIKVILKIKKNNNEIFNSFNSYCDNIKDDNIEIFITIYIRIFKMLKMKMIKL